jgi:hypothetical protein
MYGRIKQRIKFVKVPLCPHNKKAFSMTTY